MKTLSLPSFSRIFLVAMEREKQGHGRIAQITPFDGCYVGLFNDGRGEDSKVSSLYPAGTF